MNLSQGKYPKVLAGYVYFYNDLSMTQADSSEEEYDYVIIGSGFGGSVSAMRLSQKGYKVAVIESGKRWKAEDFPKTTWNIKKALWLPKIFCYGIQRMSFLSHVTILSGAGVGGGSLVYANTLYIPKDVFFENTDVVRNMGGKNALLPFYKIAQKMLGVVQNPRTWEVDDFVKETAEDMGKGDTFTTTPVGIYFGDEGKKNVDPYFEGDGPERVGCNFCGGCMVGCRFHSKNTLDKNYLYFAEKLGAKIFPETKIIDIIPQSEDGSAGYVLKGKSITGWFGFPYTNFRAKNVIVSAGVLGTMGLLMKMKDKGRLPRISDQIGHFTRTNSEAIIGISSRDKNVDYSRGIAITSSVHPDDHTHIEPVRYSKGSDFIGLMSTLMTDGGGNIPRFIRYIGVVLRHPIDFLRSVSPRGYSARSVILLVMQTLDNSIQLVRKRRMIWPFKKTITTKLGKVGNIPTYIPIAHDFARRMAAKMKGMPQSAIMEVVADLPTTAHILGGACIGETSREGVIDTENRLFGYPNIRVCDGSMIPGNLGVNPSLSITAFTERAMSKIPPKDGGAKMKNFRFEESWKITGVIGGDNIPATKSPASAE